jgi:FkbM family methyltransferase|tara:strand:- start:355 stop:1068 length:714 start_codon:yes stop_codon:yes gene_type:complete
MYTYKDTETDLVIETYHERDPMGDGDKKTVSVLVGIWNNYFENSPEIILDVGACVGIYSLLLERMIKNDNCKIYGFEPVKSSYETFVKNIYRNNTNNIIALNYGIFNQNTHLDVGLPEDSFFKPGNLYTRDYPGRFSVQCSRNAVSCDFKRLKEFSSDYEVWSADIIKIDCEGCEEVFLRDNKEFVSNSGLVFIEQAPEYTSEEEVIRMLGEYNFKKVWNSRHDMAFVNLSKIKGDG